MKVLIISHNPVSTHQNMGKTFLSLFSEFDRSELCQLYIYPSLPDVNACSSYYRITDKDIVKGIVSLKVRGCQIAPELIETAESTIFENSSDESLYRNSNNQKPSRMLARDMLWKISPWYNKELENWIKQENPTHIFLAPGYAKFIYDIALKISKKFDIPIITYICDDNYFLKPKRQFLGKLQLNLLKRKINCLMAHTKYLVAISEELKQSYIRQFHMRAVTIMTGSNYLPAKYPKSECVCKSISYFGNIRCNRYLSLAEIGRVLDQINDEKGTKYALNIYTAEKDVKILETFKEIESIKLCKFVSGKEFEKTLHSADMLLHVEAFDEENIDRVKYSISTKIADSLSSGIPFLAYGPSGVSSIMHLIRNDCALVASTKEELYDVLNKVFSEQKECRRVTENALKTALAFHDTKTNSSLLKDVFSECEGDL